MSLAPLGPPPIAGGHKDTPSTPATVPHWSSHVQPSLLQYLSDAILLHVPLLFMTKPPVQGPPTCHFHTPSSSCLPSAAVPAFLQAPFSAGSLFFHHLLLVFNSLTSSLPQPAHSLPRMPPFTTLHIAQSSTGMTTNFPFPARAGAPQFFPTTPQPKGSIFGSAYPAPQAPAWRQEPLVQREAYPPGPPAPTTVFLQIC